MTIPLDRREFLKRAAVLSAAGIVLRPANVWAVKRDDGDGSRKRLVVIFLRGAVDGLSVVIPHGESLYYEARPTIGIRRSSGGEASLDLDGHFGLHPALAPLVPIWREKTMAFVHACGSPDPSRSHFDAQDYMESGTPGIKSTSDGWMNRLLSTLPGPHPPTEAVSLGPTLPRILSGRMAVANLPLGRGAGRSMPLDRPRVESAFERLYRGSDPLSRAYREGQATRRKLLSELAQDMQAADNGAPLPVGLAKDAPRLASLLGRDPTIRLAFLALGGFDTHVNQGAGSGQLANRLRPLGEGLAGLVKGLGKAYSDTVILVVSEFGRTVRENGNGGTDHGHGNAMWVLGGNVRGGKVYGRWPGLAEGDLYQGRDLAVTTDFRDVIGVVLKDHLGLEPAEIDTVLPKRPAAASGLDGLVKV